MQLLSWESQVMQYPVVGEPGIGYFAGVVAGDLPPVDCLLWRDDQGLVRGILNHYPVNYAPYEMAGGVNIWVHPDWQRRGIGRALVTEAVTRWGEINVEQQRFSEAGAAFALALLDEGGQ
jgi:GNAT superfamily N-acetyltransferase